MVFVATNGIYTSKYRESGRDKTEQIYDGI